MATTIISGQIGEIDLYAVATEKRDVGLKVALLDDSRNPLVLLSQAGTDTRGYGADVAKVSLQKSATGNPKVEWVEDALLPFSDAINYAAGYSATATSLVVDNGAYFYQYCYGYVKRTGEIFYVSAAPSTNTLGTVTRGALGTTAAAINDNDEIIILDLANEEGADVPTARSTRKTLQYNYTEITRTPISMTDTTMNTNMLGEERDWPLQVKKAGITHSEKIELKFLYGSRSIDRTGTETKRTMNGLANIITTNVFDAGGTLTRTDFDNEVLEECFKRGRGSSYRVALVSSRMNSVISGWGQPYVRLNVGSKKLGMVVNEYISPHGVVYVVPHHQITGTTGIAAFIIDPERIKYRYLQNRDTRIRQNIQSPAVDGRVDEFTSEVCIQVENESVHAIVKNVEN